MSRAPSHLARAAKLEPGMAIGVIAPSSAVRDPRLAQGMACLERRGFHVVPGEHLWDRHGYLAGTDAARAADLTAMFARRDVDAVFCARGGYGACRMVDLVDWQIVAANPKVFVGYSDVTTLHLAFERRAGLATFYGPMVTTLGGDLSTAGEDCFWRAVGDVQPLGRYAAEGRAPQTLVGGRAEGRLAGGCLALLGAAVGTNYAPDLEGRIVVIEDVGEGVYWIDRLLAQLRGSGMLRGAAGFVVGTVTGAVRAGEPAPPLGLDTLWRDYLVPLGKPAITGFPFGHEPHPLTLPLGCMARLDADSATLTVLEPAVS